MRSLAFLTTLVLLCGCFAALAPTITSAYPTPRASMSEPLCGDHGCGPDRVGPGQEARRDYRRAIDDDQTSWQRTVARFLKFTLSFPGWR